jgi:hypothetical protein
MDLQAMRMDFGEAALLVASFFQLLDFGEAGLLVALLLAIAVSILTAILMAIVEGLGDGRHACVHCEASKHTLSSNEEFAKGLFYFLLRFAGPVGTFLRLFVFRDWKTPPRIFCTGCGKPWMTFAMRSQIRAGYLEYLIFYPGLLIAGVIVISSVLL